MSRCFRITRPTYPDLSEMLRPLREAPPLAHELPGLAHGHLEAELGGEQLHEALLVQLQGHVVDGRAVTDVDHLKESSEG